MQLQDVLLQPNRCSQSRNIEILQQGVSGEQLLLVMSAPSLLRHLHIDGDANIDRGGGSGARTAQQKGQKRGLEDDANSVRTSNMQDFRAHNVKDGLYTTNRRGVELCPGWQDGTCTGSADSVRS